MSGPDLTGPLGPGWPPARFNMAGYCLAAAADPDTAGRRGLVVVSDAEAGPGGADTWTFAELDDAVRAVAAGLLGLGLRRGDRVLIRMGNTSAYALLYFGAIAAGLVALPSSAQLTPEEATFLREDSGAAAVALGDGLTLDVPAGVLVVGPHDVEAWRASTERVEYADTAASEPAFLVYTSGTTGRPKGVLHAHRSAWGRRPMYAGWYGIGPTDVVLHAGAFNWTYTLGVGLTDPWANGATAVVHNGPPDPCVWPRLVADHRATLFAAVPGVFRQLLRCPSLRECDLSSLRHGLVAGEALHPSLRTAWTEATGTPLFEALGMSECSTFVSSSPTVPVRDGSPGRAQDGRRVAALPVEPGPNGGTTPLPPGEVGLLSVHRDDPGLMLGYWNRPEEDAQAFRGEWFVSGDLVSIDADGYVDYRGRHDDVITAGGYRIGPQEVEECLAHAPGVAEAAVTAMEVRAGVTVVAAFIVPQPGAAADEAGRDAVVEAVHAEAAEHLARYKRPREVVLVGSLPRTSNGKLQRRSLRGPG